MGKVGRVGLRGRVSVTCSRLIRVVRGGEGSVTRGGLTGRVSDLLLDVCFSLLLRGHTVPLLLVVVL